MIQYAPKVEVKMLAVVNAKDSTLVDITNWLGDGCTIHTSKSCREAAGSFRISLIDKPMKPSDATEDASVYHLVWPMDVIEIRAAHDGSQPTKLLMRGFVSNVTREESIGGDGKPVRMIHISGHDFGKVATTQMLHFIPTVKDQTQIISKYGQYLKYYPSNSPIMTAVEFVLSSVNILDIMIKQLAAKTDLSWLGVTAQIHTSVEGEVATQLWTSTSDISFWQFLTSNLDVGSFNELYFLDTETGTKLVFKPNFTELVDPFEITDADVVSMSSSRDDSGVANFFIVYQQGGAFTENIMMKQLAYALKDNDLTNRADYPHCNEKYFGWRNMQVTGSLYPPNYAYSHARKETEREGQSAGLDAWAQKRAQKLIDLNKNNLIYEKTTFVLAGNEALEVGNGLNFTKGSLPASQHYIVSVEHEIQMYESFTTTISCERGTTMINNGMSISGGRYDSEYSRSGT